jgi:glycosyltransferase involved in cell wall biosynthesis
MRVALLSYNAQAGDAIGNQVAEKLVFFIERGADARVFIESDRRLHPAVGGHCHRLDRPQPTGPAWEFLASADLIVVEYGQSYQSLRLLPLLAGGKPRILFDYHGVTPPELWGSHNREALEEGGRQRGLVWAADVAITHSQFTWRELQQATRFPENWLRVLEHPVDRKHFSPGGSSGELRRELGLENASLLLFVGRLAPNKRLPVLVEAVARYRELGPPLHLVVIGDDGDVYEQERARCQQRAAELGIVDRLHFRGQVREDQLLDAYRSADVFVMPSVHEGFCIPLVEAMACGVPVVAARAAALPETIANAGLTITADNADDLAQQIGRVLSLERRPDPVSISSQALRVAVVSFRYGEDFVGGAETSLRTMAENLKAAGHQVEVFTTCTRSESSWANQLSEGTVLLHDIPVHRFRLDPHHRAQHLDAVRHILESNGEPSDEIGRQYLRHTIHSTALVDSLRSQIDHFDAVVAGPYLFGLTYDVAQAFPEKTVLVPCFHDEPFARLRLWQQVYPYVGGILYHSPEEQEFAEVELGLNHPGATCLGTVVDVVSQGDAQRGQALVGSGRPYLVYCGRYSVQKNLPLLLDYAKRYQSLHPGRFTFVFLGQGEVPIPREGWIRDLGFVDETTKRDLLAGAAALVQLSRHESLSLVGLEAWAQGTPVIADQACKVLAGHLRRSGGGRAIDGFESFAAVLDELWQEPQQGQVLGRKGRDYVRAQFGQQSDFVRSLEQAVCDLKTPLRERMRRQGLKRAAELDRDKWRERFGRLVEEILDNPGRPYRERVLVRPRISSRVVSAGQQTVLIPVRVANQGTHVAAHEGPGQFCLRGVVIDDAGEVMALANCVTPLPGLLLPGQEIAAAMRVPVPAAPGRYRLALAAERVDRPTPDFPSSEAAWIELAVESEEKVHPGHCCDVSLRAAQAALERAEQKQRLPDSYTDVTQGFLASCKRWLKRKLLGNFKQAYVDVLSRQQSTFNHQVVTALQEISECCALLDHARQTSEPSGTAREIKSLADIIERTSQAGAEEFAAVVKSLFVEIGESRRCIAELEERLSQLEAGIREKTQYPAAGWLPGQRAAEESSRVENEEVAHGP